MYMCDHRFHLDFLQSMVEEHDVYGVILLSGEESRLYTVSGSRYKLKCTVGYHAQKKQKKGGWSQQRIDRLRVEKMNVYHKKVLEKIKYHYIDMETNMPNVKGLILAGPAETKIRIRDHDMFDYRLKDIILAVESSAEINDSTIHEVVVKVDHLLIDDDEAREIVEQFNESIILDDGLASYGPDEIEKYLKWGLLKVVLVHNDFVEEHCGNHFEKELEKKCSNVGCELLTTNSELVKNYGGIVGLLWYPYQDSS
jgi:peptide chain release factor subunit 1